jgi:hypothetical protein
MKHLENYADRRQGAWCIHCTNPLKGSRDHVPSKVFLDDPLPENLPLVDICAKCNQSFSLDEQYLACLLECAACGSTDPSGLARPKIKRILTEAPSLKARLENARTAKGVEGQEVFSWTPETTRVENVLLKLARGHAMYELNEPMFDGPAGISFIPIHLLTPESRHLFEIGGDSNFGVWPEVGSRAMQRILIQADVISGWIYVQPDRYRYKVGWDGPVRVKMVIRDYLAAEVVWADSE